MSPCTLILALALSASPAESSYRVSIPGASGSGVGIADRLVVTNSHVVDHQHRDGVRLRCSVTGHETVGATVLVDPVADLAFILTRESVPHVALHEHGATEGQQLTLIGYGGSGTAHQGRGRFLGVRSRSGAGTPTGHLHVQSIPGDSGGGVFDDDGRLVGLNWGTTAEGVSLSVPVRFIWTDLGQLETQCPGGSCGPMPSRSPSFPSIRPPAKLPIESRPPTPIQAPQPVPQPLPVPQQVDASKLAAELLEKLAADERFRGPPGPAGPPGKDGADGKDAAPVDQDAIVAAVLQKIDLQKIADMVPRPPSPSPPSREVHYVVVGTDGTAGWDRTLAAVRYAQSRYQGIAIATPPRNYAGPLPALVRYTDSVPQYVARGQHSVEQSLAMLAQGNKP